VLNLQKQVLNEFAVENFVLAMLGGIRLFVAVDSDLIHKTVRYAGVVVVEHRELQQVVHHLRYHNACNLGFTVFSDVDEYVADGRLAEIVNHSAH